MIFIQVFDVSEVGRNDAADNDTIDGDKVGDSGTFDLEFGSDDRAENGHVEREFIYVEAEIGDVEREFVD